MSEVRLCLLLLGLIFFSDACYARAKQVIVEPINFEHESETIQSVGSAEAFKSVVLYPAVGDRVTALHFKPGDDVKKGQLLLELDSRRQKASLMEAKIKLEDANRTVKRLQDSHKKGAVPRSDLDDAITLQALAKVAVTQAENELQDRQIIAPFSGIMGLTDVEVGDRITTQTAIASIDSYNKMYVEFSAPESAYALLKQANQVSLIPWNNANQEMLASIEQIDSRVDKSSRTIRVKALFDNARHEFLPGMSFRVSLKLVKQAYAVIPEAALLWGATGPYVWKQVDGKATRIEVSIQQRLAGRLLVSGELYEGEKLVVEGVQSLRQGQEIKAANLTAEER
ncbi:efflux RND transporter periplasmic adaptor subunit [Pseudoalteromonas sp. T1lg65]|uniref:efflux RND transporter periplasmic adaptor subunit n=1 Tax=Pseudoalteromonas sp. T1lg65 TaxID=2077101 RepID=UPI003F79D736